MVRAHKSYFLVQRTLASGKIMWYYRLSSDPQRSLHSTGILVTLDSQKDAERYVEQITGAGDTPTFSDFATGFFLPNSRFILRNQMKNRAMRPANARQRQSHLNKWLMPRFGDLPLDQVRGVDFEDWWITLPVSNQTKNHILYTMRIILDDAEMRELIDRNPIRHIQRMKDDHRPRDVLTPEEINRLFPSDWGAFESVWVIPRYGIMCALAVSGGLRSGEIRALRWHSILWDKQAVLIERAVKAEGDEGPPKTNSSYRGVLLPARTMDMLRWWHDHHTQTAADDLVFPRREARTLLCAFRRALNNAGISVEERKIDVHALRHTYNTLMAQHVEQKTLMAFTGHQSLPMFQRYDHRNIEQRLSLHEQARQQIELFWPKEAGLASGCHQEGGPELMPQTNQRKESNR